MNKFRVGDKVKIVNEPKHRNKSGKVIRITPRVRTDDEVGVRVTYREVIFINARNVKKIEPLDSDN